MPKAAFDHGELDLFRTSVRRFLAEEVVPNADAWRTRGYIDRELWRKAGSLGLLCASSPEEYGGGGGNFWHEAVIIEELARIAFPDFSIPLQNVILAPYFVQYGTEEQKRRWLPQMARGDLVAALAMSEPGAGSDVRAIRTHARRDGNDYIVNGQKTFITHGHTADLICLAVKTDTSDSNGVRGFSLLVVETEKTVGFRRGRRLDKVGLKAQDTAELFFDEARVPVDNLLGGVEGRGFYQLMEQLAKERINIAMQALALSEAALAETIAYVKEREVFGKRLMEFQNTRMVLAEAKTAASVTRTFVESCIERLIAGTLDPESAAMAKWWATDKQCETIDNCMQLHGGYGYMLEYPIARMWSDGRIQKIWGGSNEVMKELIARTL
ncbi:acyl-CoA dehydrogenase family protein [Bradyrhizobium jicamae]|uniref:Acyl-[acyl-carrier-protein] dehydrogenase MbtN n=1 Tax=Bradyrhizobium jicamae TaxID=280332 RepID=A0ABS5FXG2_9BRAD|nr:acyl-CoA dehydrogenase family protein [Bradyrhizobium jicamae]MBR0801477.1 acyl-CoA dehydrogenase family protein [Bradyrhizobium jicamae]MBR0934116.1 acyl-CoA dehydrogenase family protein [Bradyrhizobium jicamae]